MPEPFAVSQKTQDVLNDYKEHVVGGFAPLPVRPCASLSVHRLTVDRSPL